MEGRETWFDDVESTLDDMMSLVSTAVSRVHSRVSQLTLYGERESADTIGTVPVPRAGHFQS